MCRLYAMIATHPTKVHCELLHVQNSLIEQASEDEKGFSNPHGWGLCLVSDGAMRCKRQADPAHESEKYRSASLRAYAEVVLAHLRRATVGEPRIENTHPFQWNRSVLAHNGHVDHFEIVKEWLLDELPDDRREAIRGSTDSEHFHQLVLTEYIDRGAPSMHQALQRAALRLRSWVRDAAGEREGGLGLNILWAHEESLAGSRLDRTLWYRKRDCTFRCDTCGEAHAEPGDEEYHSVEFASERLTATGWERVPEESAFWVDDDF